MNSNNTLEQVQFLEQTLQQIIYQKQAFELELSETESSIDEIENSKGDVYKIVGQLMIKSNNAKIKIELTDKQKIIKLRLDQLSTQEQTIIEKMEKLRNQIVK